MLRVYAVALELVREMKVVVEKLKRLDPHLADQLTRAMNTITLNMSEGSLAQGRKRTTHYFTAMASAQEGLACLETAAAWGHTPEPAQATVEKFRRLIGTLHKVTH